VRRSQGANNNTFGARNNSPFSAFFGGMALAARLPAIWPLRQFVQKRCWCCAQNSPALLNREQRPYVARQAGHGPTAFHNPLGAKWHGVEVGTPELGQLGRHPFLAGATQRPSAERCSGAA